MIEKNHLESRSTLLTIHIPKTAGTTIRTVLANEYTSARMWAFDWWRIPEQYQYFRSLSPEMRAYFRCLTGHIPFGLHRYIPRSYTYMTFFRDPVDRFLSHYYFTAETPIFSRVPFMRRDFNAIREHKMSPSEYVLWRKYFNNYHCRYLAGPSSLFGPSNVTRDTLDRAKRNIEEHDILIGLTHRFDDSLLMFRHRLGWDWPCYAKTNITKKRIRKEDLDSQDLTIIEECNALDMELYEFAVNRFESLMGCINNELEELRRQFQCRQHNYLIKEILWHENELFWITNLPYWRAMTRGGRFLQVFRNSISLDAGTLEPPPSLTSSHPPTREELLRRYVYQGAVPPDELIKKMHADVVVLNTALSKIWNSMPWRILKAYWWSMDRVRRTITDQGEDIE